MTPARTIDEYRLRLAERLMAANPAITYTTPAPEPLLAIPVLEIEVDADGRVLYIGVVRMPSQATDTVQIAIDAVRRAAPFGDATRLPQPWKIVETFLFDDERRFKPRILD
jgi:protein TonB